MTATATLTPTGARRRPLWPMDPRTVWARCYSRARARKLDGPALWEVICEETGADVRAFGPAGCVALDIQKALESIRRPVWPIRQRLAETVLNGFGSKNPWGGGGCSRYMGPPPPPPPATMGRPGARMDRHGLRNRLKARGLLILDGGGWVRGVRSAPGITVDDFVNGRPVVWTGWNGQRFVTTYYGEARGPGRRTPPGIVTVYAPEYADAKAQRQLEPMTEAEARARFLSLTDPRDLNSAAITDGTYRQD